MYLMDRRVRVLIAEGDAETQEALADMLERAGVATDRASDGRNALRLFYRKRPDAIVLALELESPSGWQALATIRELSDVPVMTLAGRDLETEKIRALREGADDFVAKPFSKAEVLARLEALLRRPRAEESPELFEDDFVRIDHVRHRVEVLDSEVDLTPTEFRMLTAFCRHAGQALTHVQLLGMVWGEGQRDPREVKLYVSYLRRKLRASGVEPVETVRGIGYRYQPQSAGSPSSGAAPRS
jgi:DNA-binding response OmpR family regulator